MAWLRSLFDPRLYEVEYPYGFTAPMSKAEAAKLAARHEGIVVRARARP